MKDSFGPDVIRWFMMAVPVFMAIVAVLILLARAFLGDKVKPAHGPEGGPFSKFLTIPGVFTFLAGFWLLSYEHYIHFTLGLAITIGGCLAMMAGIFLEAARVKAQRSRWLVVPARCVKRELKATMFSGGEGATLGWVWRVNCEFEFGGHCHRVEPKVHWSDIGNHQAPFWSKEKANQFMESRISSTGECKLRVKPDDPREAELI